MDRGINMRHQYQLGHAPVQQHGQHRLGCRIQQWQPGCSVAPQRPNRVLKLSRHLSILVQVCDWHSSPLQCSTSLMEGGSGRLELSVIMLVQVCDWHSLGHWIQQRQPVLVDAAEEEARPHCGPCTCYAGKSARGAATSCGSCS